MSDEQNLLAACVDYRAKLDKLEAENTALWENRARLWDECADWHEAYCSVGEALGVNEPEYSGRDFFAELVKELVAENAALRADKARLDWLERRTVSRLQAVLDHVELHKLPIREAIDLAIEEIGQ
jgi:hypothetical protein